jgi:hypothetical protein
MISSGYTLDLYCDHLDREIEYYYDSSQTGVIQVCGQYFSDWKNPKTDAFKQARKAGWKINLKERTCICSKCRKLKNYEKIH